MLIVIIVLLIGGFFVLAFLLAGGVVLTQSKAKKQAQAMIDNGNIDKVKAKKVLKILSACRDNEGKRLYNKLADLTS